ncbi:sulfate ABC transporter permease subunit CysT [Candidatus Raskinella chloraquaticus]|uniref:sulfate ABC transporter permease subunit CysT n=1 Tax=Candidatus Raskinella chloraquaticus TaxID=1951219 RepID=UPI00366DC5A3
MRTVLLKPSPLPGFTPALGAALLWLGLLVLIPLAALVWRASGLGLSGILAIAGQPRVAAALKLSFGLSLLAAALNVVLGGVVAWVLTRYEFPGRRLLDAAVDLPFALPTAVAGIALTAVYAPNGWIGAPLDALGFKVAFTPLGIFIALVFIGLPFMVRSVEPVLSEVEPEIEEASATLGASRLRTIFQVVLPPLVPAFLTGFALALARAVGEYGSVVFISGNIPFVSEIAPLLIVVRLEEFDEAGATAVATIMLALSFAILLIINLVQAHVRRRTGHD